MNSVIELVKHRVSCPKLAGVAPSDEELNEIFACAVRAPDHARLKPWHFHVVRGQAREKLGELFVREAQANGVSIEDKLIKCRNMPLRAPLLVVAVCEPTINPKVPAQEQVLAVGAAIQNMQIAISSLGYGSIWRTGDMAESQVVKDAFGLSEQGSIVGFVYIGQPVKKPVLQTPDVNAYVSEWGAEF